MAEEGRSTLKSYFETGDVPTQGQYANLIDSSVNKADDIPALAGGLAIFTEVSTGALLANTPKTVTHNLNLSAQFLNVRSEDGENNAMVQTLKPLTVNSFQIKIPVNSTGLTVQIIGIQA
ncbi:MAG: hypothetical protein R3250_11890 [Melioribacteraceae bacterium]|nr:hypothetical protein [Melioribacteraceae bacterium]